MFNNTKNIQFLIHDESNLFNAIQKSISQARKAREKQLNVSYIDQESVTSASRNKLRVATIHKFFHGYSELNNKKIFNKDWVCAVFEIVDKGIQSDAGLYALFTEYGRTKKLTGIFKGALKVDCELLLHYLWLNKAILLPASTPLPLAYNPETKGNSYELAAHDYPEVLRILRNLDDKYSVIEQVGEQALKNMLWSAYRLVRASTWYDVRDITDDDFRAAAEFTRETPAYTFPLRQWLSGISLVHPDALFDISKAETGKQGVEDGSFYYIKISPQFSEGEKKILYKWIENINSYVNSLKLRGMKTFNEVRKVLNGIVGWLINKVQPNKKYKIPSIAKFERYHCLGDEDGLVGLFEYLREGRSAGVYRDVLYKFNLFFKYLATFKKTKFINPINIALDTPMVARSKGTTKKILPSDSFAPLLSFSYALADFAWYVFEKSKVEGKLEYNSSKKIIDTEKEGFVPLFWVDGKPYPIRYIPYKLLPTAVRCFREIKGNKNVPEIHSINLMVLILETGLRGLHARWLCRETYRNNVNKETYKPRGYGVNHLYVNADKSHGPWTSFVSNTVIEILDRQADFRDSFNEKSLKKKLAYDDHEHSSFDPVVPLFSLGGVARGNAVMEKPISDQTMRDKHSILIYIFSVHYFEITKETLIPLRYENEELDVNSLDGFSEIWSLYDKKDIEITVHSARSQVVSSYITMLPPSEIMKITGHQTEAHVIYYAQLDKIRLEKLKEDQTKEIMDSLRDPVSIRANDVNSNLRKSFLKNRYATIEEYGATAFDSGYDKQQNPEYVRPLELLKSKSIDELAFNTTHICPFNNICPKDVVKALNVSAENKPCGGCFYSIKTVDHIPAILAKIRSYTDESTEIQGFIKEAKSSNAASEELAHHVNRRHFLTSEIVSWTLTFQVLEQMASDLSTRESWLVEKPELLSMELEKIVSKDESLEHLFIKAAEAKSYAEFFTPTLNHQITKARTMLLAKTGNFQELLNKSPNGFDLIDQFRGNIKSICNILNLSLSDLSESMEQPLMLPSASETPIALFSKLAEVSRG